MRFGGKLGFLFGRCDLGISCAAVWACIGFVDLGGFVVIGFGYYISS